MKIMRYRKREPIEVDAIRVTVENIADVVAWCHGKIVEATYFDPDASEYVSLGQPIGVKLLTADRLQVAMLGDYIYKDYEGSFHKKNPSEFIFEYELIQNQENKV